MLPQFLRAALKAIARAQVALVAARQQRIVPNLVQHLGHFQAVRAVRDPELRVDVAQVEHARVLAQGFLAASVGVLVKVAHREFARRPVHRVAVAQRHVVGLRDRAPATAAAKERDHMVVVVYRLEIEEERRLTVNPERARGDQRGFDAMRASLPQDFAHRQHRVAVGLEVRRDRVEERLDFLRCVQPLKGAELAAREPEVGAACETLRHVTAS